MRLRKGDNPTFFEEDYYHVQLKQIIDRKTEDKKIKYYVEWMDGRKEWVPLKRIQHESLIVGRFDAFWYKMQREKKANKTSNSKEGSIKHSPIIKTEEEISPLGSEKKLSKIKTSEIIEIVGKTANKEATKQKTFESNLLFDNGDYKNKMSDCFGNLNPVSIEINAVGTETKKNTSDSLMSDKKQNQGDKISSPSERKPNEQNDKKKKKAIPTQMLKNKRERNIDIVGDDKVVSTSIVNNEKIDEIAQPLKEVPPIINYPLMKIVGYEEIDEVEYLVQWKPREDGFKPQVSFISEKTAKEKYSVLLIDFLSKTLKEKRVESLEFPLN